MELWQKLWINTFGRTAYRDGKIVGAGEDEDKEKNVHYSLREQFTSEFDAWMQEKNDKQRLVDGGQFEIGKTSFISFLAMFVYEWFLLCAT